MIVKPPNNEPLPSDPRHRAGAEAERQMAFYLHRDFASDSALLVINDLRLVDPDQPEYDGRPGVCQIDHLVLHRWGAFIIESKSVTDEVSVRGDGAGGDEWTRRYGRRQYGFPSPIQQARRQGEFLRAFLQRHREHLLGKMPPGLRTLTKLMAGTDQRGFTNMPIQIIVAISDRGKIRRVNGWNEPEIPFRTFVSKADLVPAKIREELGKHKAASSLLGETRGEYGVWSMKAEELPIVAGFLASRHTSPGDEQPCPSAADRTPPAEGSVNSGQTSSASILTGPACKSCGGTRLTAKWGKYGYYWKCLSCSANTSMPTVCPACGAEGNRGKSVRIRKDGPKYFRACQQCGVEELIWTDC
ncbi:MAG: NERD domain-containing protein [Planctomycetota bacterium]|nr:MAG: NERD domain-containing protein [Planctomycetota bacterium]